MTKDFVSEMKSILLKEKERIEAELNEISVAHPSKSGAHVPAFENIGDGEDENAEEVTNYGTNLSLERTLDSSLRDVVNALDRIQKGTYGICKYCNKPIDEKRLRARPESSSCIECKKSFTQEM